MERFFIVVLALSCITRSYGQEPNKRCCWVSDFAEILQLDTISIDPSTITTSVPVEYEYSIGTGTIFFKNPTEADSIELCYRVVPFALNQPVVTHTMVDFIFNVVAVEVPVV